MQIRVVADCERNALQGKSARLLLKLTDSVLQQIPEAMSRPSRVRYRPSLRSSDAKYCLALRNSITTLGIYPTVLLTARLQARCQTADDWGPIGQPK
jgi:hypothetical protein